MPITLTTIESGLIDSGLVEEEVIVEEGTGSAKPVQRLFSFFSSFYLLSNSAIAQNSAAEPNTPVNNAFFILPETFSL